MAPTKRPHGDETAAGPSKKTRKGFSVGPANLPEGTHKRKVQKIKRDLIEKAKIKKQYSKIRKRELAEQPTPRYTDDDVESPDDPVGDEDLPATLELHPDRQKRLDDDAPEEEIEDSSRAPKRQRRQRPVPFSKEAGDAQRRKEEAQARREAREQAEKERQKKIEERERHRRAMAKARVGGPNGQRKLGRESQVLLEKVKRMVEG